MSGWEDKSNFEINKAVAELDGRFKSCIDLELHQNDYDPRCVDVVSQGVFCCSVEYCGSWEDAGPIMSERGIATLAEGGKLIGATTDSYESYEPHGNKLYECRDKNPLRAAMIVYLEMNGVKP